jgi:intraflagellar transport protein 88
MVIYTHVGLQVKWQLMVASCYRRTGAYPLALAKYKEILLQHPENIECLRYLIHMYTSLGRQEEVNAYENQLRKVERGQMVDSHYQNQMVLDPNKGFSHQLLLESQAYAGNDRNTQVCDFSQQSTNSQGFLSTSGILNPRLISTHSPQPYRTSEQHMTKKKERVDEDEWPELGDDLLPM